MKNNRSIRVIWNWNAVPRSAIRWNAIMTVLRASKKELELGGHMASFRLPQPFMMCALTTSSVHATGRMAATWFTSRATSPRACTLVFLEGRLTQEQLDNFRQEVHGNGLSSYPHPKLMPEFWQFRPYLWVWPDWCYLPG
ncbi:hypothetical protein ACNKHR_07420 [Shigella flexneri]